VISPSEIGALDAWSTHGDFPHSLGATRTGLSALGTYYGSVDAYAQMLTTSRPGTGRASYSEAILG
jgi:hypothetical protein